MRIDPRGTTAGSGQGTAPGPGSTVGAHRPWEFAPETQDAVTYARPTMLRPNGPVSAGAGRGQQAFGQGTAFAGAGQFESGGQLAPDAAFSADAPFGAGGQFGTDTPAAQSRGRGRLITLAAGGTALVVAIVAYLAIGRGHGTPGPAPTGLGQATAAGGAQNALGPGVNAAGPPTVTAKRVSATKIRFHWTYTNQKTGDTFNWQRVSGSAGSRAGHTAKPELFVKVAAGQHICIEVEVVRAKGTASDASAPSCWPS